MRNFVGIIDKSGVESFLPLEAAPDPKLLRVRAQANSHRKAIAYSVFLTRTDIERIQFCLNGNAEKTAGKLIKGHPSFKDITYA